MVPHPTQAGPKFASRPPGSTFAACLAGLLACLSAGDASAGTFVYASGDVPKIIPDNNSTGNVSELVVSDSHHIEDLDLILDELLHEAVSDLRITLTSPTGTTAILLAAAPDGGILAGLGTVGNFVGTVFDDQAPTNLRDVFLDNHVGTYNIDHSSVGISPLSVFNGEDAQGTWILRVTDRARFDVGVLNAWSLRLTTASVVPEPSGFALAGIGLAGLFIFARRGSARI